MGDTWEGKWDQGIQIVRGLSGRFDGLEDVQLQRSVAREPLASHSPVDLLLNSWCQEQTFSLSQEMEESLAESMELHWGEKQSLTQFREMSPGGREEFVRGKVAKCCGEFRMLQTLCTLIQEPPRPRWGDPKKGTRRSGHQRAEQGRSGGSPRPSNCNAAGALESHPKSSV